MPRTVTAHCEDRTNRGKAYLVGVKVSFWDVDGDSVQQTVPTSRLGEQKEKLVQSIDDRLAKITNVLSNLF
jgi:hypothetical protein